MDFKSILSYEILSNTVQDFIYAIILFLCIALTIYITKSLLKRHFRGLFSKKRKTIKNFWIKSAIDNLIPLLYLGAFYLSLGQLGIKLGFDTVLGRIFLFFIIFYSCIFLSSLTSHAIENYFSQFQVEGHTAKFNKIIKNIIRAIIWFIGLMVFLDHAGIRLAGLLTGLGVGGIALAFLAQSLLKDALSYLSIHVDKPFEVGDLVTIDEFTGIIEAIGIKTTKIRSVSGELVVFSNVDITGSRVRNFQKMDERRALLTTSVIYKTSAKTLASIPKILSSIVAENERTRLVRCNLKELGKFSIDFETVFYVNSRDLIIYMEVLEKINLRIKEVFDKKGIVFAYSTFYTKTTFR